MGLELDRRWMVCLMSVEYPRGLPGSEMQFLKKVRVVAKHV